MSKKGLGIDYECNEEKDFYSFDNFKKNQYILIKV
jgi:hypothetical protein